MLALLAILVAVVLTPPIKDFVQNLLDRAFYRDRYDYRRALVGFARDSEQRPRSPSTVGAARVARRSRRSRRSNDADARGRSRASLRVDALIWVRRRSSSRARRSDRRSGGRLYDGHIVALDDPTPSAASRSRRSSSGAMPVSITSFLASRSEGTIAVLAVGRKDTGEPLSSEDTGLLAAVAGRSRRRSRTRASIANCT